VFCSDDAYAADGPQWEELAPGLRTVLLRGTDAVDEADLASVDIASFSADLYPTGAAGSGEAVRTGTFLRIALEAPNLRWMHVFNVGVDNAIFQAFRKRGVRLTTSAGSSAAPIAHSVIMHLLAMCRRSRMYEADQRAHLWRPADNVDVEGRTLGVVGLGSIGCEVARLGAQFGMRVVGVRRAPTGAEPCETWTSDRLGELLPIVDDLVLAAPLNDATRNLIGASELASMRRGAHLVNIGRGELIDEPALVGALMSGQIGAAALDVFAVEPLPKDSPLWDLPNVTVTPHAAGGTALSRRRASEMFTENLRRFLCDEPLINEVP
jgi:phosphoglycerate dehydrogenase-like enzyme